MVQILLSFFAVFLTLIGIFKAEDRDIIELLPTGLWSVVRPKWVEFPSTYQFFAFELVDFPL
eukprot:4741973-Amphidinium_carterae.2